ncbi:MAG: chemotaxis protein CheW [Haloarculaceae archaeon]
MTPQDDTTTDDDDDERMARAKRIRRLREGQRSPNGDDDGTGGDGVSDRRESSRSNGDGDEPGETEDADDGEESPANGVPDADTADDEDEGESGGRWEDTMNQDDATTTEDDAMAAAQRAAQAAIAATDDAAVGTGADGGATAAAAAVEAATQSAGAELPDQEQLREALAASDAGTETPSAVSPEGGDVETEHQETADAANEKSTRVLEFALGDELYCLDIEYVEEIVKRETITRVPNTAEYVEGVVDLRGQITTILDPKTLLDIDQEGPEQLMVVFDPDAFEEQGAIGWLVDEVRQVGPIVESEVNDPPVEDEYINGVVDREDETSFVIWTDPDVAMRIATAEEE